LFHTLIVYQIRHIDIIENVVDNLGMIVTLTLNPALDKTARVDVMRANGLNRLRDIRVDAGGKGVNVSAVIRALGGDSIAAGFAGGAAGDELLARIAAAGINADFVRIASATRTNLKVLAGDGALTELNEPGPEIAPEEWRLLEAKLLGFAKAGTMFVLSGSLPRGLPADTYRRLCTALRAAGAAVFLDADGRALKLALDAPPEAVPDYLKPNRYELLQYFGVPGGGDLGDGELAAYCGRLLSRGIKLAALSLGAAGALFVNKDGIWRAPPLPVPVKSTVGAGDSMVAALAYGLERGLAAEDCFALAMAASAGAVTTEGTRAPEKTAVDRLLKEVVLRRMAL
jgi:1-phosphofructokinase